MRDFRADYHQQIATCDRCHRRNGGGGRAFTQVDAEDTTNGDSDPDNETITWGCVYDQVDDVPLWLAPLYNRWHEL